MTNTNLNIAIDKAAKEAASWDKTPFGTFSYDEAKDAMTRCPGINGECDMCPFAGVCPKSWM